MVNGQYKDATIKLFLKSDERRIIRLINYIRGTNYPEDMKLSDNTLETPVYRGGCTMIYRFVTTMS